MFEHKTTQESQQKRVEIKEMTPEALEKLIQFAYSRTLSAKLANNSATPSFQIGREIFGQQ